MLVVELTTHIRYDVDCSAHAEADQGQPGVLRRRTRTCCSQQRVRRRLRAYLPIVKDVQDSGYEIMLPVNASAVIVVIAHHDRRGQVSRSVSWKKNARKDALTLHKHVQNSTVDANWHLR